MSWDKINHMLSKFNFTFTWKYSGDGELRSLLPDVFRVLDDEDERYMDDKKALFLNYITKYMYPNKVNE